MVYVGYYLKLAHNMNNPSNKRHENYKRREKIDNIKHKTKTDEGMLDGTSEPEECIEILPYNVEQGILKEIILKIDELTTINIETNSLEMSEGNWRRLYLAINKFQKHYPIYDFLAPILKENKDLKTNFESIQQDNHDLLKRNAMLKEEMKKLKEEQVKLKEEQINNELSLLLQNKKEVVKQEAELRGGVL